MITNLGSAMAQVKRHMAEMELVDMVNDSLAAHCPILLWSTARFRVSWDLEYEQNVRRMEEVLNASKKSVQVDRDEEIQ